MFTKARNVVKQIIGGEYVARKTFTTTIDEEVQKDFKTTCIRNDVKMNDVLEAFMKAYSNGEFKVEIELKIKKVIK